MPDISQIGNGLQPQQQIEQPAAERAQGAPAEFQRARPSVLSRIGRVLAAVFSVGITEIVRYARAGKAPAAKVPEPGLPAAAPQDDMSKQQLIHAIDEGEALPPAFQAAVDEAVSTLRSLYGEKLVPEGATFGDLPGFASLRDSVVNSIREAPEEVQPGHLLALITETAVAALSEHVFTEKLGDWCRALGLGDASPASLCTEILQKNPEFAEKLHASGTRSSAEAKIEEFRGFAEKYIQADAANRALNRALDAGALPQEFQESLEAGLSDLRGLYGEQFVPQGATLRTMPGGEGLKQALQAAVSAATDRGEIVRPGNLRSMIDEKGVGLMAEQVLERRIAELCEETGFAEGRPDRIRGWILQNKKDIASQIRSCATLADAQAAVAGLEGFLAQHIALRREFADAQQPALDRAAAVFAQRTGLSEEAVRAKLNTRKLVTALGNLDADFYRGTISAENGAIAREFNALAERFAEAKAAVYNSIDALALPDCLKEAWKADALTQQFEDAALLPVYCEAGRSIDASALLAVLEEPAGEARDQRAAELMVQLVQDARNVLLQSLGEQRWEKIGGPGQSEARYYAAQAMFGAVPGLLEKLAADPALCERLQELTVETTAANFEGNVAEGLEAGAQASLKQSCAETAAAFINLLPDVPVQPNEAIAASLNDPLGMPLLHGEALRDAIGSLRSDFGEELVPAGATLESLGGGLKAGLEDALRASAGRVSPEALRSLVIAKGGEFLAERVLEERISQLCDRLGYLNDPAARSQRARLRMTAHARNPGLAAELRSNPTRAAAQAAADRILPDLEGVITDRMAEAGAAAAARERVISQLALRSGLPAEKVRSMTALGYLNRLFDSAALDAKNPLHGQAFYPAFEAIADRFIEMKAALIESADRLPISEALKEDWKTAALLEDTLDAGQYLEAFCEAGRSVDAGGLLAALENPGQFTARDILGILESLALRVGDALQQRFGAAAMRKGGADFESNGSFFGCQAMLDKVPGLREKLASMPELVVELSNLAGADLVAGMQAGGKHGNVQNTAAAGVLRILSGIREAGALMNGRIADALGKPEELPAYHAFALSREIASLREAFGPGSVPEQGALKAASFVTVGKTVAACLAERVRASEATVSSGALAALYRQEAKAGAAFGALENILAGMAAEQGLRTDFQSLSAVMNSLKAFAPDLMQRLSAAESRADVEEIAASLPQARELLRAEHNVLEMKERAFEYIRSELAAVSGLPAAEVAEKLNLSGLDMDKFSALQKKFRRMSSGANGQAPEVPQASQIRADFMTAADEFLAAKRELCLSVRELPASDALKASWMRDVLAVADLKEGDILAKTWGAASNAQAAPFISALENQAAGTDETAGALSALFSGLEEQLRGHFSAERFLAFDSNTKNVVYEFLREALFERNPGIVPLMKENSARMSEAFSALEERAADLRTAVADCEDQASDEAQALLSELVSTQRMMNFIVAVIGEEEISANAA